MTSPSGEVLVAEQVFRTSFPLLFQKAKVKITDRRLIGEAHNYLLGLIPVGRYQVTFPLHNIASITIWTDFHSGRFLLGLLLALSVFSFPFIGLSLSLISLPLCPVGATMMIGSFLTAITVTNNSGDMVQLPVAILDRQTAMQFVDKINEVVAAHTVPFRTQCEQ